MEVFSVFTSPIFAAFLTRKFVPCGGHGRIRTHDSQIPWSGQGSYRRRHLEKSVLSSMDSSEDYSLLQGTLHVQPLEKQIRNDFEGKSISSLNLGANVSIRVSVRRTETWRPLESKLF